MQRVYLQKIIQHGNECYIGKIDPRILVRIAKKIEMSETQDAQRPLNEKRVKEIAKYVNENGIIPSTLTIATSDGTIAIKGCEEIPGMYYADFPSLESEFDGYLNAIDVMDGQHRLYSFLPDIRLIADTEKYEVGFTLYDKPLLNQRRKIFVSCNEKQEKVNPNLLLWFKQQLGMLTDEEKAYFSIVAQLADEFPLKGHIIMSAEKKKNGVKAKEVIADLKHVKLLELSFDGTPLSEDDLIKILRTYLCAWQSVVGFDFATSSVKEAGVAVKMAGLKYMIYVLPAVWDYSIQCKEKFTQNFVSDVIRKIIDQYAVLHTEFFKNKELNAYFRDRTMITKFADETVDKIKKLDSAGFNPLDF